VPLYLDVHRGLDASEEAVNEAHLKDLEAQEKYGVTYLTYWFNRARGHVFCLVDAPNPEAAIAVHTEATGIGKQFRFGHRQTVELKGFADPVPVHEVIWRESGALDSR